MALLESAARYPLFFGHRPLTLMAPFFERVPMALGGWDPRGSTATAYAWFVWMRRDVAVSAFRRNGRLLSDDPEIHPIPPGTRARLTRADDARLFGRPTATPLLDGLE